MVEMSVYVGTYAAYNSGSLRGEWLNLSDYESRTEFYRACAELHKVEHDPEFMFQDWEGIPEGLIGESWISESCWDVMEAYGKYGEDQVNAFLALFDGWDEEDFNNKYRGEYESWAAMAEDFLDETGELADVPEHLRSYIDFQAYGRDIRLNGDMVEHDHHFFWS